MLAGELNLPRAGCLHIGMVDLIPKRMWVVTPAIVLMIGAFVKHLPDVWAEEYPPVSDWWTPAPALQPNYLEL